MGIMSEKSQEIPQTYKSEQINDLLMKPFSLGWTREVVMRVNTKNRAPNCDIYYFSPSKKKIRSLTELKNILTDDLNAECFSFKREPLGLGPHLETIRDARTRRNNPEKSKGKEKIAMKKPHRSSESKQSNNICVNEIKEEKTEIEEVNSKLEKDPKTKLKGIEPGEKIPKESNSFSNKKKKKRKSLKQVAPVKLQSLRLRKKVLKRIMTAKQVKKSNVVESKKILKKIVQKIVNSPNQKLSQKNKKEIESKGMKSTKPELRKTKKDEIKESESNATDKKSTTRDLKSIVKKNIGKYREMREKQKLGTIKNQKRNTAKTTAIANITRTRSEPISKNKPFYLKPLERGWRRELVYRSNSARAGQKADVYYFHPNGKKLRSCREIAKNLTHGLTIECFTFRKEPIGCGEPSEVVRNARFIQKNQTN